MFLLGHFKVVVVCHICILISYASHVDALDVQRMDVKHAKLEPNHKTVFGGHLQKMEGLLKQPKTRPKVGRAQGRK